MACAFRLREPFRLLLAIFLLFSALDPIPIRFFLEASHNLFEVRSPPFPPPRFSAE